MAKNKRPGKPHGMNLAESMRAKTEAVKQAAFLTGMQYAFDLFTIVLNDPEVMGKDTFGYERIKRVKNAAEKLGNTYADALTTKTEADYARAKLDGAISRMMRGSGDFKPFEQRYEYLKEVKYD